MSQTILPGATLGVLGSGQLGRMFAIAARRLGYRVHVFSPDDDTPTGQVADREVQAKYDDLDAVADFAKQVAVVTFEFENIPAETVQTAAKFAPVRPAGHVLHTTQNRLREKSFLHDHGLTVPAFQRVTSLVDLSRALSTLGCPAVLKTAAWGYDGKGQAVIRSEAEASLVWPRLNTPEAICEAFVDFKCELSVVAARSVTGDIVTYSPFENAHRNHILDVTVFPARIDSRIAAEATEMARTVMQRLDVVGVLCVEMFLTRDNRLLINELAPRPHNSGHLTIDACVTCQFEQQVRAVCGLPLGSTDRLSAAAMANLLGDEWEHGEPNWQRVFSHPQAKLHLYGKREPRPGRKMGHITALAHDANEAERSVLAAREASRQESM
jgi:5-(carboxyamino)imidazole ribonucleotide synthase